MNCLQLSTIYCWKYCCFSLLSQSTSFSSTPRKVVVPLPPQISILVKKSTWRLQVLLVVCDLVMFMRVFFFFKGMIVVWMRRFWKFFMVVGFGDELQTYKVFQLYFQFMVFKVWAWWMWAFEWWEKDVMEMRNGVFPV